MRKPLASLTANEVKEIADPAVKKLVQEALDKYPGAAPKEVFADETKLPFFQARDGRKIPIRKVRVRKPVPAFPLGSGNSSRYVTSESNHHIEIFAELDRNGRETEWDAHTVSLLEAVRRKKEGKPIVQRDHGIGREFRFSLAPGEIVEWDAEDGTRELLVVTGTSQEPRVAMVSIFEARDSGERNLIRKYPNILRKRNARKVRVTLLGEVKEAHD